MTRILEFSNESTASPCPRMFDQAYQGSETKKPPKIFATAKVLLRYPNKKIRLFLGLHEKNQTGFQSIKKTI